MPVMSTRPVAVDLLILGGGIAGLWSLAQVRASGRSAILLEAHALGAGQTIASQGIIHGGVKYALGGAVGDASEAIAEMPAVWRACLRGEGSIDLRRARVLSDHQFLWTRRAIGSRIAGLVASKSLRAGVEPVADHDRPVAFENAPAGVDVYRVPEPVLDPRSLVESLAAPHERHCLRVDGDSIEFDALAGRLVGVRCRVGDDVVQIKAGVVLFAAGEGNEALLARAAGSLGGARPSPPAMQRRPLHMVMAREVRQDILPPMYAHAIGMSSGPLATVTSQRTAGGRMVWWIGGGIAESGIERSGSQQMRAALKEMASLAPWIDWSSVEWATMHIDRAEQNTESGKRPERPALEPWAGGLVCWPSKLAFAPLVAQQTLEAIERSPERTPQTPDPIPWAPAAPVARFPWEQEGLEWH